MGIGVHRTLTNVYLYRGEQYDFDLNLYDQRARYLNPLSGRFLTRDPTSGRTKVPATLHKYLYAATDPVNGLDPSGRGIIDDALVFANNALRSVAQFVVVHRDILAYWGCTAALSTAAYYEINERVGPDWPWDPAPPPTLAGPDVRGILIAGGALTIAQGFCGSAVPFL